VWNRTPRHHLQDKFPMRERKRLMNHQLRIMAESKEETIIMEAATLHSKEEVMEMTLPNKGAAETVEIME